MYLIHSLKKHSVHEIFKCIGLDKMIGGGTSAGRVNQIGEGRFFVGKTDAFVPEFGETAAKLP